MADDPAVRTGLLRKPRGLSLSLGWEIRGNFGHEYGKAIPGALAAIAVVLISGRSFRARCHNNESKIQGWTGTSLKISDFRSLQDFRNLH